MKILVDALSVNNVSGRHVLMGHLHEVVKGVPEATFVILHNVCNADMRCELPRTEWIEAPAWTARWWLRGCWLRVYLKRFMRKHGAQWYVSPAGMVPGWGKFKRAALAQNPWCLVALPRKGLMERLKAFLQRRAYGHAMRRADVMVFNSRYMREAYEANAGQVARRTVVASQGVDEATFEQAAALQGEVRVPGRILCVSVMALHKNVESVLQALALVHAQIPAAHVHIVGGWPDANYRAWIEALVKALELEEAVSIMGHVSRETLELAYAQATVFCLMSRCESFGIPAVEAQVFGTPVVSSTACAVPEICGEGGQCVEPDDVVGLAEALGRLLVDEDFWKKRSQASRQRAEDFHWERCSEPLVKLLRECAQKS